MRSALSVSVAACVCLALLPSVAVAQTVEHASVSRTVAGPDAVAEAIQMLRGVELGAQATTLTLQVDGGSHDVRVDYGALEQQVTGREGPSLVPLAMLAAATGGITRGLRFVARVRRAAR